MIEYNPRTLETAARAAPVHLVVMPVLQTALTFGQSPALGGDTAVPV